MNPRPRAGLAFTLLVLGVLGLGGLAPRAAAQGGPPTATAAPDLAVELSEKELKVGPGEKFSFESVIRNAGDADLAGYVAHLNILTTDESVYVDPEDWSPVRTQYFDLGAGGSTTLQWSVQAVTSGPLILYVSVTSPDTETVTSSGPLNLTVQGQRVVNSGGVLPLVVWMPAGVFVLLGATFLRKRRHR